MEVDEDEPLSLAEIEELEEITCHVCRVVVPIYNLDEHEVEHQKNLKNLIEPTREEWSAFILSESGDCYYSGSDDEFSEVFEEGTCIPIEIIQEEEKITTKPDSATLIKKLADGFTLIVADAKESKTSVVGGDEERAIAKPYNTSPADAKEDAKESEVQVGETSQGTKQHHKKPRLDCSGPDIRSFGMEDSANFVAKGEEKTLGTTSETNQSEDMVDGVNEKPMTCHLCKKVRKNKEAFVRHLESRGHDRKFRNMILYTFC